VVSAILKDLEMEYLIMNPDSKLSLRNGGKKALRLLLQEGKGLKAFDRYKVRLLPIIKFLYEGDEDVYSIKEATQLAQEATGQVNLLDVESVLAFELTKQYAPAYLEYTTVQKDALGRPSENIIRAINNGKTYRATNSVKEQVSNYLTQLAQGSNFYIPNLFKGEEGTLEEKLKKEDITIDHILAAVKNPESAQGLVLEILEAFEHLFDSPFTMDIVYDMTSSTTTETSKHRESINKILSLLDTARNVFKQVKFVDKLKDGFETRFDELLEDQMFKSRDFKRLAMNLKEGLSDIPVINFTSGRGTSIPVYKINSAIADDVNYIHRYKSNSPIRKLLNIFVAYPQLLSNINKVESGVQPVYNEDYPGATGLKLETILESGSNPNSKGSAGHSSKNSFLGDFLGLGRVAHAMAVQPLPYSDKSSAFTKNLNLDVEMEFPSFNKTLNKVETVKTTLFNATNDQIARLYFNFEKRKQLDIVIKILNDWKRVLDLDIQIPSVTDAFAFPTSLARVIDTWHEVDNYLIEHQITFDGIRSKIF
jgi:hypothetical protein